MSYGKDDWFYPYNFELSIASSLFNPCYQNSAAILQTSSLYKTLRKACSQRLASLCNRQKIPIDEQGSLLKDYCSLDNYFIANRYQPTSTINKERNARQDLLIQTSLIKNAFIKSSLMTSPVGIAEQATAQVEQHNNNKIAISFQIMTRAEPATLVQATIASLLAIKNNCDEILVIDNNHTDKSLYEPLQSYCAGLDKGLQVKFYHKDHIPGYKAGALNLALEKMNADCQYIVVVDSDYQALPCARARIVAAIQHYPDRALLQFPQYYRDSDKADIHAELNHYFSYHIRRDFNRHFVLSTGTFAVINKLKLFQLGGWSGESITEDAQMGVLMHQCGESSLFIPEVIAIGLLPQTLHDLVGQRRRWIYGNMQVLSSYLQSFIKSYQAASYLDKTTRQAANSTNATGQTLEQASTIIPTISIAHTRAHLSQLSAWVNFTGGFIGLQAAAILALIITERGYLSASKTSTLRGSALAVLTVCYFGYGVYLMRRLSAYLQDTQPLQVAATYDADTIITTQENPQTFKQSLVAKARVGRLKHRLAKLFLNATPKPIAKVFAKQLSRIKSSQQVNINLVKHSPDAIKKRPNATTATNIATPITNRLRAWLVHLNFWEIGALSWLPVLWGQQKPFVCTPKFTNSQSPFKATLINMLALPKLLIVLNVMTAFLVRRHSKLLLGGALSLVSLKLTASYLIINNFANASKAKVTACPASNTAAANSKADGQADNKTDDEVDLISDTTKTAPIRKNEVAAESIEKSPSKSKPGPQVAA